MGGDSGSNPLRPGRAGLVVVIATILAVAVALVFIEINRERDAERERDARVLERSVVAIESLAEVLSFTETAQSLVDASGDVAQARFEQYARALLRQPAVSSVAFERRVTAAERDQFESEAGLTIFDRDDSGSLTPSDARAEYFPIVYFAPAYLSTAAGFDLASEPVRRAAIVAARETGRPSATAPVRVAPNNDVGVLTVVPLYASDDADPPDDDLVGLVTVAYYADQLAARLRAQLPVGTSLRITDGEDVMVGEDAAFSGPTATVEVLGRDWTVSVRHPDRASMGGVLAISSVGLLLAALTGAVGAYLLRQHRRLERAQARTALLQAATAEIARCQLPDEVRACAMRRSCEMLSGSASAVIARTEDSELHELASWGEDAERLVDLLAHTAVEGSVDESRPVRARVHDGSFDEIFVALVPSSSSGTSLLTVGRDAGAVVTDADLDLWTSFTVVVGAAMRRAETHDREHSMAQTLQRQLLAPTKRGTIPSVTVGARYQPALDEAGVGGDWYDVIELDPYRLGVTVGDVVGHGIPAAGAMGQLRVAIRALAGLLGPAQLLEQVDALAADIPGGGLATAVYLEIDLAEMAVTYSVAGHLPPVLIRDGQSELLWDGRGPLLALDANLGSPERIVRPEATRRLERGDRLIVYTDGLVERRGHDFDDRLDELLSAAIATAQLDSEESCDAIIELLGGTNLEDDVALAIITLATDPQRWDRESNPPDPAPPAPAALDACTD
jgi:CHASE1-domain containing sensor protein